MNNLVKDCYRCVFLSNVGVGTLVQLRSVNFQGWRILPSQVPTAMEAVAAYENLGGTLTVFPTFGVDPLAHHSKLQAAREQRFHHETNDETIFWRPREWQFYFFWASHTKICEHNNSTCAITSRKVYFFKLRFEMLQEQTYKIYVNVTVCWHVLITFINWTWSPVQLDG